MFLYDLSKKMSGGCRSKRTYVHGVGVKYKDQDKKNEIFSIVNIPEPLKKTHKNVRKYIVKTMTDTEYPEPKTFPSHLPEYQTRSRQLPKELLELQDYLKQLSVYVEKYNRIKDNLARQNIGIPSESVNEGKWWGKKKFPYREMGFSVKEDVGVSSPLQVIEMAPHEEVTVISENEKRSKSEEESSLIANPVGKTASDESQIGIYFIEHVKPVNFVNVLQRELSTLGKIFPGVNDITKQITHEFDHFKVCQKCLEKVSPLLPDILKELQELIKFVKKKRNEVYIWPDDSDYLRKTSEALSKPFEKQVEQLERKKIRQETVGFVTVHTNTPQIIKEWEANVKPRAREKSEHIWKCSMRASDREQLTFLQSKIQTDLTQTEKAVTAEAEIQVPKKRNGFGEKSILGEFSTSQVLKTLHPRPVLQIVEQYKVQGNIEHLVKEMDPDEDQSNKFLALNDPDRGKKKSQKFEAFEVREFLLTAKTALRKACLELEMDSQNNSEIENELKTDVEDLKSLMLEVHKNQIELSKVVLEKEVLKPAVTELSGPLLLREEKEGVKKTQIAMGEANLDNQRREDLQYFIDELKSKCEMKNRLIMSLLKGLRSNVPCEEWEELITRVMQDSDSLKQLQTEKRNGFFKRSSLTLYEPENVFTCQAWSPCIQRRSSVDEILSEREIAGETYEQGVTPRRNSARISFSEIISKKSESLCAVDETTGKESPLRSKSFTMKELNVETEKLFKDLENEVNSLTFEHYRILCDIEGLKRQKSTTNQKQDNKIVGCGSRAINLTIKIGDRDSISGYHSALSIVPSGATLKEKKSELSFPVNVDEVPQAPGMRYSIREFKSAINLSKEELIKRQYSTRKSTKSFTSLALKLKLPVFFKDEEIHRVSEGNLQHASKEELDNYLPASLNSNTTSATAWKSKHSIPCCENVPDSYFEKDFRRKYSSNEDFLISEFSRLHPEMNVHCEQNETMNKLKSRLKFLEDDLRALKMTIDRMDILTEKLVDDACKSSENFKCVSNIFRFITGRSNI